MTSRVDLTDKIVCPERNYKLHIEHWTLLQGKQNSKQQQAPNPICHLKSATHFCPVWEGLQHINSRKASGIHDDLHKRQFLLTRHQMHLWLHLPHASHCYNSMLTRTRRIPASLSGCCLLACYSHSQPDHPLAIGAKTCQQQKPSMSEWQHRSPPSTPAAQGSCSSFTSFLTPRRKTGLSLEKNRL